MMQCMIRLFFKRLDASLSAVHCNDANYRNDLFIFTFIYPKLWNIKIAKQGFISKIELFFYADDTTFNYQRLA